MLVSIIVAMGNNRVIGNKGQLPWHLPEDLQRFKRLTMGHSLIMGRRTFESIGRPLPGRQMIVLSRDPDYKVAGCDVVSGIEAAFQLARSAEEVFICGGAEIYQQTLSLAERIYLTKLGVDPDGDALFPEIPVGDFKAICIRQFNGAPAYQFSILQRCESRRALSPETENKL
ncbi:dihydrofolate reductase [uncultured Desulfuromusa sp.]|uniref:dihydrofolate reductase n=1 Tax=uncultured Desulfuromusa sp. TaxID=219183 RepID=UPI002AA7999A|nr:dihydrofolate reductase [uncultured Desulfuromusa sp.]